MTYLIICWLDDRVTILLFAYFPIFCLDYFEIHFVFILLGPQFQAFRDYCLGCINGACQISGTTLIPCTSLLYLIVEYLYVR